MEPTALVFPTQLPPCQPTPVTIPTLSLMERRESAELAFVYAEAQSVTALFSGPLSAAGSAIQMN